MVIKMLAQWGRHICGRAKISRRSYESNEQLDCCGYSCCCYGRICFFLYRLFCPAESLPKVEAKQLSWAPFRAVRHRFVVTHSSFLQSHLKFRRSPDVNKATSLGR